MVTATGLQTDYGYDAYGNSTSVTIRPQNDTGAAIRSDSTYTADGNMLASTTGGDRNTVTYSNDTDRSPRNGSDGREERRNELQLRLDAAADGRYRRGRQQRFERVCG